jgi:RHS repeat-associated protein
VGTGCILLSATDAIAPNQTKTFTFTITAPPVAGNYNFQWQMVREGMVWFGDMSTNAEVSVSKVASLFGNPLDKIAGAIAKPAAKIFAVIADFFAVPVVYAETTAAYKSNRQNTSVFGYRASAVPVAGRAARISAARAMAQAIDANGVAASSANITTTKNYQYDANGNLISDGTNIYDYDYHNRLVQITGPTTAVPGGSGNTSSYYEYDAAGQRFLGTVETITVDSATGNITYKDVITFTPWNNYSFTHTFTEVDDKNGNRISVVETPKEITKHIFANGQAVATIKGTGAAAKSYINLTDHLNGTTVVLDQNKNIVETADYYPFGKIHFDNQANGYSEKRKYIGQEYDEETNLSYLNARYYNGTTGRFITEDPVFWSGQNLSDPQSLNVYSYANNNPITLSDPNGLMTFAEIKTQIDSISAQIVPLAKAVGDYMAQTGKAVAKTAISTVSTAANMVYNVGAYSSAYMDSRYAELKAAPNPTPQDFAMHYVPV